MTKEDWDRKLSYSMTISSQRTEATAQILTEVLVSLYSLGWSPLAPLATAQHQHTAVCFKRTKAPRAEPSLSDLNISTSCFCLQRLGDYLVLRGVPSTLLYTLVTSLHHTGDIAGVSLTVSSVIVDYAASLPPVLHSVPPSISSAQSILLHNADLSVYEGVMSCLAREGYSIALDVEVDSLNAIYFFVKDRPAQTVKRMKSVKLKHRSRVLSLRRKVVTRQISGKTTDFHNLCVDLGI